MNAYVIMEWNGERYDDYDTWPFEVWINDELTARRRIDELNGTQSKVGIEYYSLKIVPLKGTEL